MAIRTPAICVIGDLRDINLVHLKERAQARGFRVIELAERSFGRDWSILPANCEQASRIVGPETIPAAEVAGFFVRPRSGTGIPAGRPERAKPDSADLWGWLDSVPGVVINRPGATRRVDGPGVDPVRFAQFGITASALPAGQTPGRDVRVHTVAGFAFATEFVAPAFDHPANGARSVYRARPIPEALAESCCRLAARQHLWLAALDFRVTADHHWTCVGLNAAPDFVAVELMTGQPITDRILDLYELDRSVFPLVGTERRCGPVMA